jgi:hypothetical protein
MLSFFHWLRLVDPTQRAVRKYARAVVRYHQKYPERPLQECMPGFAKTLLRKTMPEGTYERNRLESIIDETIPCYDPVEFCCRLATFETGVMPADGLAYLHQAEIVAVELSRIGFHERSTFLDKLRSSIPAGDAGGVRQQELSSDLANGTEAVGLTIPRYPKLGNWIGVSLFGGVGLVFLLFGHPLVAVGLTLAGLLSLVSTVMYWEIDEGKTRLCLKSGRGLPGSRQHMSYPAHEITGVELEIRTDSEGGREYSVFVIFEQGQRITVSRHWRDADRIARFLGVEKSMTQR